MCVQYTVIVVLCTDGFPLKGFTANAKIVTDRRPPSVRATCVHECELSVHVQTCPHTHTRLQHGQFGDLRGVGGDSKKKHSENNLLEGTVSNNKNETTYIFCQMKFEQLH